MNKLLKKALILCLSALSIACFTACDSCGGEEVKVPQLQFSLGVNGYSVSLEKGSPTVDFTIEVPSEYNGLPVVEIADKGFANRMYLSGVSLPSTIERIGEEAFANTGITTITMPCSVEEIGVYAFGNCKYLSEIVLKGDFNDWYNISFSKGSLNDEVVEKYGYDVYSSNPAHGGATVKTKSGGVKTTLNQIIAPENVEEIGVGQFRGFVVQEIIFSDGLKVIREGAFLGASGFSSLSLPNSLEKIGVGAFKNSSLTQIELGTGLTTIDKEAFYNCKLTQISIPNNVTTINQKAFQYCEELASVEIGSGIEKIGVYVFADSGLTEITLPATVKTIDDYAFIGATSLKKVNFSEGLEKIGDNAFAECTALESIVLPSSIVELEMSIFYGCTGLKSMDFGDGAREIPNQTLDGCKSLTQVRINKKIGYINQAAFRSCTSLKNVYYTGTKKEWENVWIGTSNSPLTEATVHYMSN